MNIKRSRNLVIAEFMGYPYYFEDMYHAYGGPIEGDILEVGDIICKTRPTTYESHGLRMIADEDYTRVPNRWYDQSWDELIPVIQKLRGVLPKESVYLDKFLITLGIKNVWKEVVDLIILYNEKENEKS
jgi:hypothetical protein